MCVFSSFSVICFSNWHHRINVSVSLNITVINRSSRSMDLLVHTQPAFTYSRCAHFHATRTITPDYPYSSSSRKRVLVTYSNIYFFAVVISAWVKLKGSSPSLSPWVRACFRKFSCFYRIQCSKVGKTNFTKHVICRL